MRKTETTEQTRKVTTCVQFSCDICDKDADRPERESWEQRGYDVVRTTVAIEEGTAFPEGRNVERQSFDICPECFKNTLIPFLESLGAKPTVTDLD